MTIMADPADDFDAAIKDLNDDIARIKNRTLAGLLAAGLFVQGEAQRRVPIHFGILRASAYTRVAGDDKNSVEVGFSAAHALWIHEDVEMKWKGKPRRDGIGEYWGPSGQAKFLENVLTEQEDEILRIVADYAEG